MRVCRPVLQILTLFQTKKCNLSHPFSDQTSKIHTPFLDLAFRQKLCYHYLDKSANKKLFKSISNPHISLSFAYSFGIETMNKFTYSRSSLENHTRFQTKIGKVYTRFQTKTSQKPSPIQYNKRKGRCERWTVDGSTLQDTWLSQSD